MAALQTSFASEMHHTCQEQQPGTHPFAITMTSLCAEAAEYKDYDVLGWATMQQFLLTMATMQQHTS